MCSLINALNGFPMPQQQQQIQHTLVPGAQAARLENIVAMYERLTGRTLTPQEIEQLRAHRKAQGIEE